MIPKEKLDLLLGLLTEQERTEARIFVASGVWKPELIHDLDGERILPNIQDRMWYWLFVDLAPGANWAHPCAYLLSDVDGTALLRVNHQKPPLTHLTELIPNPL